MTKRNPGPDPLHTAVRHAIQIIAMLFLVACSHQSIQQKRLAELPCYDGWGTYRSGSSVVYSPTETELREAIMQLPADRALGCWHQRPSGKIDVLSVDSDGTARSTKFIASDNGLIKSNSPEEFVIRFR